MHFVNTKILLGLALVFLILPLGCSKASKGGGQSCNNATLPARGVPQRKATPKTVSRKKVQAYIREMTKQYDMANRGLKMEWRYTEDGLKIVMLGEAPDEESLKVLKAFFEHPITNPDLPVPLIWEVSVARANKKPANK